MIDLETITRQFGETEVLHGITLSVAKGGFTALLGPSGCGKSTLLRILAGLDRPTSGAVRFGGRDVSDQGPAARNVAMVFQAYALYPHLTVAENIAMPLAMRGMTRAERSLLGRLMPGVRAKRAAQARAVRNVAEMLEIGALLARKPAELSGGQKQRVALARALVRDPSVFLLDEPLSNLDAKLRVQMRAEIVALHRKTGGTFVHVTHDQTEAMGMADQVAVLLAGRIAQVGTPRDLYERPATRDVAAFVGTHPINLVPGAVFGVPGEAGLRPEHLTPGGGIAARLLHVEYQGAELLLEAVTEAGTRLRAVAPGGWQAPAPGAVVLLGYAPQNLHRFDATGARVAS
ncbi:MAG: ABC transporter ATP-binding protein [Paracoccaceae bacterium]